MATRVVFGNRVFEHAREWAGDRPALVVASYPKMLRAIVRQLNKRGHWLAYPIDVLAQDWDGDPAVNLARLNDILAHADELTEAQVSYLKAAITELQERSKHGYDTEADDQTGD